MMKLQLSIELANQIIGYLGTKPYQEVYQLIDGIKDAAKPQENENGRKVDSEGNQQAGGA